MNIEQWLYWYPSLDFMIRKELENIKYTTSDEYISVKAQVITDMPRGSKSTSSTSENFQIKREEQYNESLDKVGELYFIKYTLQKAFEKLTPLQMRIIQLRYFEHTTFEKISEILKDKVKSRTTIWKNHKESIKIIKECYNENENNKTNIENVG